MAAERIDALRYGDVTYEAEGAGVDEAIGRALALRTVARVGMDVAARLATDGLSAVRVGPGPGETDLTGELDVFLRVRVASDGSPVVRAILREF